MEVFKPSYNPETNEMWMIDAFEEEVEPCSFNGCDILESFVSKDPIEDTKEEIMKGIIETSKMMFEASDRIEELKEILDRLKFMNELSWGRLLKLKNGEEASTPN